MVVDDDPIFRLMVGRVAGQLGRLERLRLCASLAETEAVKRTADLWVVDVNLPDGNGPDWVKQQREEGFTQPVWLLSHSDLVEDLGSLQPCQFSRKPGSLPEMRQLMQGWWT